MRLTIFRLITVSMLLAVSACGGTKKTVVTKDDSADYQAARSLPALKKPARSSPAQSLPVDSIAPSGASATEVESMSSQADVSVPAASELAQDVSAAPENEAEVSTGPVTARVVNPQDSISWLQIDADFDAAWSYLSDNLKRSDVTVYSRNKSAGRFSIGCADIDSAPIVKKRGGWSFFTKKKTQQLEYCALQAIFTKGSTVVKVLNRAGQEVSSEYASQVFERILNN